MLLNFFTPSLFKKVLSPKISLPFFKSKNISFFTNFLFRILQALIRLIFFPLDKFIGFSISFSIKHFIDLQTSSICMKSQN